MFEPIEDRSKFDFTDLDRQLDRVKSTVFRRPDAAFFGPLMCSLNFVWSEMVDTAATDGSTFWWNPKFFAEAPDKYLEPRFNEFVMMHELNHVARLHMLRQGNRDPEFWNFACDIRINNDLVTGKYSFGTFPAWFRPDWDQPALMAEEDIYDRIKQNAMTPPPNPWGNGDMVPTTESSKQRAINNVVKAVQSAKVSGQPGAIPGSLESILEMFLSPIIPWELHLYQWMSDLLDEDYTWARPARRYTDIYLPSRFEDEGRLQHLMYFQDVSGSITDAEIVRFNSELRYIWDTFKPKKMTVAQFDTRITKVDIFNEGDPYEKIFIVGRGGTSLVPVRQMIIDEEPTAAIIFSDMCVSPMAPLPVEIPILWVATNAHGVTVPFGKIIHIKV